MYRKMRVLWAAALSLSLAAGGVALAAPPTWAHAGGGDQSSGHSEDASSTGGATTDGSGTAGSSGDNSHAGGDFGQAVVQAVYAAHEAGDTGTVLANAIHEVQSTEHPDAHGLAVAEAVYQRDSAGATGQGGSPFEDVTLDAPWAETAVNALENAGVVTGTSTTTFDPNASVTLAELATMLDRLQAGTAASTANVPAGTPSWALNGMAWAQQMGVLGGEQGLGAPNTPLTRAQAVLMLINAAGLGQEADTQAGATIALQGTPPSWAHGALALAIELGLLQGSNGQLLANQPLTRAQMAVLLARLAVLEAQASSGTSSSGAVG